MATDEEVLEVARGFFRPVVLGADQLVVADAQGILYRMHISDGKPQMLWDGMPGVGRYGWTVHEEQLIYIDPDKELVVTVLSSWPEFTSIERTITTLNLIDAVSARLASS